MPLPPKAPAKVTPFPPKALANVKQGLAWLQLPPKVSASITHFTIVRIGGQNGHARVVFGKRYSDCSDANIKKIYAGDAKVDDTAATAATSWFRVRGAVRASPGGAVEVIPSTKENQVLSAPAILRHVKDLKKALADAKVPTAGLQKLLDAKPVKAVDISRLVDEAAGRNAPGMEEPAVDAPPDDAASTLGLDEGAAVKDPGALAHAKQFRALVLDIVAIAKDPRRTSQEEADRKPMREALMRIQAQLSTLSTGIVSTKSALEGALLGTRRYANSIALLEELGARADVAAGRIEKLLKSVKIIAAAADVPVATAADVGVAAAPPQPVSTEPIPAQLKALQAVTDTLANAAEELDSECEALGDRDPSDAGLSVALDALRGQLAGFQRDLETYSGQLEAIRALPGSGEQPKLFSLPSTNLRRVRQALQNSTRAIAATASRIAASGDADAPARAPAGERLRNMESQFSAALAPHGGALAARAALAKQQNDLATLKRKVNEADDGVDELLLHTQLDEAERRFPQIEALRVEADKLNALVVEQARLEEVRLSLERDLGDTRRPRWLSEHTDALSAAGKTIQGQISNATKTFLGPAFVANVEKFNAGVNAIFPHIGKGAAIKVVAAKHARIEQLRAMRPADYADFSDRHQALTRALAAWDAGLQAAAVPTAEELARTLDAACDACADAQRARGVNALRVSSPTGRRAFEAMCASDPGLIASVASTRDGRDAMDTMVTEFGGMISDAADRNLVKSIMKARFGLDQLEGDLSRKSLPRLYEVFTMVPAHHTHSNPLLKAVVRNRNYKGTSDYTADMREEKVGGRTVALSAGSIVLNGVRSGGVKGWVADKIAAGHETAKYREVKGKKSMNSFNVVTLHEIGHAVDADQGFMEKLGDDPAYGGWQAETPESVAKAIGTALNFFGDFREIDQTDLVSLLATALRAPEASYSPKNWVSKFSAKTALKATEIPAAVHGRLAGHAAFARCQALRVGQKVWSSASKAQNLAMDGRVYLEAYPSKWYSYDVAALASRVTDYQFRAPGEWFSEAYAAYFEGKLPDSHVLTPWLEAQKRLDDPSPRP
jgi:hypothetical protein